MNISEKKIVIILLSTMMFGFAIFAYFSRKPLCIDSELVNKIEFINIIEDRKKTGSIGSVDNEIVEHIVYRCGLRQKVTFNQNLALRVQEINRRLKPVEGFLKAVRSIAGGISLKIILNAKNKISIEFGDIKISSNLIDNGVSFEFSIFHAFTNLISNLRTSKEVIQTTSNLFFMIYNQRVLSLDGQTLSSSFYSWPQVIQSLKGYCDSPVKWIEHLEKCSNLNYLIAENHFQSSSITDFSLQYYFAHNLYLAYKKLPLNKQIEFLQKSSIILGQLVEDEETLPQFQTVHGYYAYARQVMNRWVYVLAKNGMIEFSKNLDQEVELSLLRYLNISSLENTEARFNILGKTRLDFLLYFPDFSESEIQSQINNLRELAIAEPESVIGLQTKDRIFIFPSKDSLPKEFFLPIVANKVFYISCGFPHVKEILEWKTATDRLIAIDHCNPQQVIDYSELRAGGLLEFSRKNNQLIYISYHIPSLKYFIKNKPEYQNYQISVLPSQNSMGLLREQMGWQNTVYNPLAKAYAVKSVIEAIDYFKIPVGTLPELIIQAK